MPKSEKQAAILQALAVIGPMTQFELARYLRVPTTETRDAVYTLRTKGMVRIVNYVEDDGPYHARVPVYAEGSGADLPRPKVPPKPRVRNKAKVTVSRQELGVWAGLVR